MLTAHELTKPADVGEGASVFNILIIPAGRVRQETSDEIRGDDLMATTVFNKTALANGTSNLIVRADALNQSSDLVQAGVVFNDAMRASLGLFNLSGSGNSNPFLGSYTTDIHAVQNDIAAMLANAGSVTAGGQAFTLNAADTAVLTTVEGQLATLLTAAPQTTNAATIAAAD